MCPDTLAVAVGGCLLAGALGQVEGAHLGHLDVDLEQERLVPLTLHSDLYQPRMLGCELELETNLHEDFTITERQRS